MSLYLIRRLVYGPRLSLLDIVVGLSGGGIDVVGYFRLDGRFFQNIVTHGFAGSLLLL